MILLEGRGVGGGEQRYPPASTGFTGLREGGHIGYRVVPGQRRRGHATQMLAQAKPVCRQLGLTEILVTCAEDNLGSRRVIEANGGTLDRIVDGEAHYRLPTSRHDA
jgi:predicted acetyltransferase